MVYRVWGGTGVAWTLVLSAAASTAPAACGRLAVMLAVFLPLRLADRVYLTLIIAILRTGLSGPVLSALQPLGANVTPNKNKHQWGRWHSSTSNDNEILTAKFISGFHFAAIYQPFQQGVRNAESWSAGCWKHQVSSRKSGVQEQAILRKSHRN